MASVPHTILIGDDHEEMRRLVVELLTGQGHEVHEADDTQSVLDQVVALRPDLLILDVHMPGAGGVEALRKIRQDSKLDGMRVLLLSGSVDLASDWPQQIGADAQLPKPFQVQEFNETVRSLLAA